MKPKHNQRSNAVRLVRGIACFALGAALAWGQGSATIVGTVTDPTGAAIPAAKVKATNEGTGVSRDVVANAQGYFVIPSLQPAGYVLSVQAAGFSDFIQKGIDLLTDQTATVNVRLVLGRTDTAITVEGTATQVNTTTSTLSQVVDERRIQELPLNGRNAATLVLLVPGAVSAPSGGTDQGIYKTFPGAVTISTNGSRQNQISFKLDGGNNVDIYTNVNQPFPFPDALQEFSVQTSNYSAKYGGNAGAVVNVVTKSGSNELHGTGFEFVRNEVLNARGFFTPFRDTLKRNQFGGTLGGPLVIPGVYNGRNKTFFFFGYQNTRLRNLQNGRTAYVPTTANLSGDFSAYLTATNPANALGRVVQVVDPATNTPFAGNLIPASRFDAAAIAFTKYLPQAGGNGLITYGQPSAQDTNEFLTRVDHVFSAKDKLNVRYFLDRFTNVSYLDPGNYVNQLSGSKIYSHNALINETHIFRPNLLNDFRISFVRVPSYGGPPDGIVSVKDLGVNIFQPGGPKTLDGLSVTGFFSVSAFPPSYFTRNSYSVSDEVSWVIGRHTIAFGGSIDKSQVLIRNGFLASGNFSFTADFTNQALASFLLGKMRTFRQGGGEYKDNGNLLGGLFIQDDFHVSSRLTLNLGLRWEPFLPWKETRWRIVQFRPEDYISGTVSQVYRNAPPGMFFAGDKGVPERGATGVYTNFAPRLGFAYDLNGNGKTSIRGGGGIFYDAYQTGILNNRFVNVTPFSTQISFTDPTGPFRNPYSGLASPFPVQFPPPADVAFPEPVLVISYDPANKGRMDPPVIYNWNLSLERQLTTHWLLRAAYVGSHSTHITETIELNPAAYIPGSALSTDARRIFRRFGSIGQAAQDVNGNYHSLQLTGQRRFSGGLTILANYTWSRSIDGLPNGHGQAGIASQSVSPIPWYFPGRHQFDTGRSEFDRNQRMVVSFSWELPKVTRGRSVFSHAVNGWQLTGIFTAQAGGPYTILAGRDSSLTGLGADRGVLLNSDYSGAGGCLNVAPCVDYLKPSAFGLPATGTFGNIGKGALNGPNLVNLDLGLFKNFLFRERFRLQFHAEFFNTLNRVNLNNPTAGLSTAGFGSIRGSGDPRIGQLALKFLF